MQTIDNQPIQLISPQPANNQSVKTGKSLSLTHRQSIFISAIGGLVLLLIFGIGVRAGEKRALRKYFAQPTPTQVQPTPVEETNPPPTPTVTPSIVPTILTPTTSHSQTTPSQNQTVERGTGRTGGTEKDVAVSCDKDTDCIICYVEGSVCTAGDCINGVCVWPTPPPSKPRK